ncbi:MAG: dihydroorotate dehydrogenase [Verrucomicrobia bacterium]|nr:dihydroorotate dehydrogenase [Verrucomicrobiota bacterium]
MKMAVNIGGATIKNPVMTASGTYGYGDVYTELCDVTRLGAVVTKGVTLEPAQGNPPPRGCETASGMLNAIGLQNVGVAAFIAEKLPPLRERGVACVVNVQGSSITEFVAVSQKLTGIDGVTALELNVSCPNKTGGLSFGTDPKALNTLVTAVRKATPLPLMTKLSPNVTDITVCARAAVDGGTDSLSVMNTVIGMAVNLGDPSRGIRPRPVLRNVTGGLSGPAIKPVALRMVWQVVQAVDVPVIGIGGIASATDALEFLAVGASAVQIGTASFYNPRACEEVVDGIAAYMTEHTVADINDLIGTFEIPWTAT